MRKIFAYIMMLAMMLALLSGCTQAPAGSAATDTDTTLYQKGLSLIAKMDMMAESEEYISMLSASAEMDAVVSEIGARDYSAPTAVYKLNISKTEMMTAFLNEAGAELPEELMPEVEKRFFASLPSQINGLAGASVLAAASIVTAGDCFDCADLADNTLLLYLFEDGGAAVVSFIPGSDNAVSATGTFIINDELSAGVDDEELNAWLQEALLYYTCQAEKIITE